MHKLSWLVILAVGVLSLGAAWAESRVWPADLRPDDLRPEQLRQVRPRVRG